MFHRQKGTSEPPTKQKKNKTDYIKFVLEKVIHFISKETFPILWYQQKQVVRKSLKSCRRMPNFEKSRLL